MESLHTLPVTAAEIKRWTDHDQVMSTVRKMILQGWQPTTKEGLQPFYSRRIELSVQDGCILWGNRVVSSGTSMCWMNCTMSTQVPQG